MKEVKKRKTNTTRSHLHVEAKKMIKMNLFTRQKHTHRLEKHIYGHQSRNGGGMNKLGVWD